MTKITADLIWKCPHFFNALNERELDLRGNKFAVIENLGATEDQFDTVDFSDNEIVKLDNFPYLNRLVAGALCLFTFSPGRKPRMLFSFPCPAEFLPKLHALERLEVESLFTSKEVEVEMKKESTKTFTPKEVPNVSEVAEEEQMPKVVAPTPEQIIAIKAAIVNSQTLEEVARLEKALKTGQLPADLKIPGDDTNVTKGRDENKVSDIQNESNVEPDNVEEEKNEEPAPMEQVYPYMYPYVECVSVLNTDTTQIRGGRAVSMLY
ncbi:hypothetical protein CRYUN_Cryun15aG0055900 [Craigia yunnanensis]